MIRILNATLSDVETIRQIAEKTWWPAYGEILTHVQIRYMLDVIYSENALKASMDHGHQQFIMLCDDDVVQGFASFAKTTDDDTVYKLHKLYVLPENPGKGYGTALVHEVIDRLLSKNIHTLVLNVNRNNKAKRFYEKLGFQIISEEDIPIGPYWMNDYVMRLIF
jgi:ribosomal protein S18 acetylase RimI-like enzyme